MKLRDKTILRFSHMNIFNSLNFNIHCIKLLAMLTHKKSWNYSHWLWLRFHFEESLFKMLVLARPILNAWFTAVTWYTFKISYKLSMSFLYLSINSTWVNGKCPTLPLSSPSHWPFILILVTLTMSPTWNNDHHHYQKPADIITHSLLCCHYHYCLH